MINILSSKTEKCSSAFNEVKRKKGEDNLRWLNRNFTPNGKQVALLLIGGIDPGAFRLRVAQSHLRHDLTPSHWSHAAMIRTRGNSLNNAEVYEISLHPVGGFGFPPPSNSVQQAPLSQYRDPKQFPNVALIRVPVSPDKVNAAVEQFQMQRALDATELLVLWLAYIWGVGRSGNPLLEARGIPSAAMLEVVIGAVGYDLTPGLESRSSCPEAIWQSARWWHDYYEKQKREGLSGAFIVDHYFFE